MEFGFNQTDLEVSTSDGCNFRLLEPLVFQRKDGTKLRAPAGSTTDGMSIPDSVKVLPEVQRLCKKGFLSAVIHDSGFRGTLEILTPQNNWMQLPLAYCDQAFCDGLIKEALISQGINEVEVETVFLALRACGWRAFSSDRSV